MVAAIAASAVCRCGADQSARSPSAAGGYQNEARHCNLDDGCNARPVSALSTVTGREASVDGSQPGDDFAAAFDRHAPAVLRYARRRLESPEAAWDVVSETFTAAWRHWDRRPGAADLLPWLYAIAGNAVRDQRRSAERRRRLAARLSWARGPGQGGDPAETVVLGRSIGEAVARLPEIDREVLRLVAWEGLTDARALGVILGLSPTAARSRVHRARRRLRALLGDADVPDTGRPAASPASPGGPGGPGGPARLAPASSPVSGHAKEA
jgi:RNA polymerase sigma-70 factor (ECF subfamily)